MILLKINFSVIVILEEFKLKHNVSYDELIDYFIIPGADWKVNIFIFNIFNQTQILFISFYLIQIYYIPDACHYIKLARNAVGSCRKFKFDDGI